MGECRSRVVQVVFCMPRTALERARALWGMVGVGVWRTPCGIRAWCNLCSIRASTPPVWHTGMVQPHPVWHAGMVHTVWHTGMVVGTATATYTLGSGWTMRGMAKGCTHTMMGARHPIVHTAKSQRVCPLDVAPWVWTLCAPGVRLQHLVPWVCLGCAYCVHPVCAPSVCTSMCTSVCTLCLNSSVCYGPLCVSSCVPPMCPLCTSCVYALYALCVRTDGFICTVWPDPRALRMQPP